MSGLIFKWAIRCLVLSFLIPAGQAAWGQDQSAQESSKFSPIRQPQDETKKAGDNKPLRTASPKPSSFKSEVGGFEIQFASKPTHSVSTIQPAAGQPVQLHLFRSTSASFAKMQSVGFHDLKKLPASKAETEKVFRNCVLGIRNAISGEVTAQKSLQMLNSAAQEIHFQTKNADKKILGQTRFLIRGKRVYQLSYVAVADQFDQDQAKQFFESMRFIKIVTPPKPSVDAKAKSDKAAGDEKSKIDSPKRRPKAVPKDAKKSG